MVGGSGMGHRVTKRMGRYRSAFAEWSSIRLFISWFGVQVPDGAPQPYGRVVTHIEVVVEGVRKP